MSFFWFKFYSRMEGRILGFEHQLDWRLKEIEGTRNRLLQPPPHGILRVGRRRSKTETTLMSLFCINYPWVICHPLPETFFLLKHEAMVSAKSRAITTVTPSSVSSRHLFCLPSKEFLCRGFWFPDSALARVWTSGDSGAYLLQS